MEMIEVKTEDLIGHALDWAVARAIDYKPVLISEAVGEDYWASQVPTGGYAPIGGDGFSPSTNWSQGGPLLERYKLGFTWCEFGVTLWCHDLVDSEGPTHLIAACRAIVSAKIGKTVQVPKELIQ